MNRKACFVFLAAGLFAAASFGQWQWIDKDGRKVFSDQAPPPEVPAKNILRQPGGAKAAATAAAAVATPEAPAPRASAPRLPAKDAQLEARKKQAEDEEAAKRRADEEKVAKARAENCERARRNQATLKSGIRLQQTNDKGERQVLDEAARAAEAQHVQGIIDSDCK